MPTAGGLPQRVLRMAGPQTLFAPAEGSELKRRLLSLHQRYPALGLDSLYHLLKAHHSCSREKIHRLMKAVGILLYAQKAYKATTNSRHRHPIVSNLLKRQFSLLH